MKPEKALGRLKLVEEMMRNHAKDVMNRTPKSDPDVLGVFYGSNEWATMLEELQDVIAEIEKEMTG